MNQNEIDLLNFENELLQTRRKLNDLVSVFPQRADIGKQSALPGKNILPGNRAKIHESAVPNAERPADEKSGRTGDVF